MTEPNLDEARHAALDRIDRAERSYRLVFYLAALVEAAFLAGFVLLADLSERIHLLLLLSTVAVYTIVALGLMALGAHVSKSTLRILRAIELGPDGAGGRSP